MMGNGFPSYHPYTIFFYYICVGVLSMYFNHPVFLILGLIILIFINISHDKGKSLRKWTFPLIIMGSIFVILNPFLVSRGTNILFYFRGKQVTLEATMYGIVMSLALVSVIIIFVSFNLILNGNKFLFIFSKILPRTAFLIMLSIRFIPLVKGRLDEIMAVQRVRGITLSNGTLKRRAENGMLMLKILLTWSLEEAVQTADSMKARGYGIGKKSSYIPYKIEKRDWTWIVTLFTLFVICIIGGILGYGKIHIYPELGTLHLYPIDWILLICMTIIYSFPLITEGREWIRWRY